jgi:cyclophilin family peptidyl-prolyl cis-trans isomerase
VRAISAASGTRAPAWLRRGRGCVWLLAALCACESSSVSSRPADEAELLHAILIAEDSRSPDPRALAPLAEGIEHANPEIRRVTVRALGRLERADLIPQIQPLLQDPDAAVRAEAANALAQSVFRETEPSARTLLLERLGSETDEGVKGALAQSLGRLRHADSADVASTATALVQATSGAAAAGERDLRVAKGLYLLARQPSARGRLPESAVSWLESALAASSSQTGDSLTARRTRTLAMAALVASGQATPEDFERSFSDPAELVRREPLAGIRLLLEADSGTARALVGRGLEDSAPTVRYQALAAWEAARGVQDCEVPQRLARDANGHIALRAIELLTSCAATPPVGNFLDSLVLSLPSAPRVGWHRPATALVSLAFLEPQRAAQRIQPFSLHQNPFVRGYAARAAGVTRDSATLRLLARDADPNVRTGAIEALMAVEGPAGEPLLIEQLELDDPQLLIASARLLTRSRNPAALPGLLAALERVSSTGRETSRDARLALLDRIAELGDSSALPRIRPFLQDFDPAVAAFAANVIQSWTGARPEARAAPLARAPVPAPRDLDLLEGALFTVEMAEGGSFDLRLRAWDAPTNAARFARLAEAGYFDGLTYHRVVPNFVIQGGSPAANEYAGDGPFTRDELGLDGHWMGTAGISTRGRDTGDAQMFVNLIDNVRLDHDYTVFAEVVRGMDVVQGILEGDVIRRIRRTSP